MNKRGVGFSAVISVMLAGAASGSAASSLTSRSDGDAPTLSVMTYNIEGLPFPIRKGRGAAATRIGLELAAMRAAGTQPHVVVLQEAFGTAQKAIGREAGYAYVAFGPGRHARNDEPMSAADRSFAADARRIKGEDDGKWAGSGLAILSDYPLLTVKREAFPTFACAGLDCLANKGVMMATVAVPGVAQPVTVIATHMNSKQASGVAPARFTWAFLRQVQTIGTFLRANLAANAPYVFAGDTNIGKSAGRRAAFQAMLDGLPRVEQAGAVRTALATCLEPAAGCALDQAAEVRRADAHGKDWEAYADGDTVGLAPIAVSAPFGHDAHGRMLSDHIGYTALYRMPTIAR